jgi:hypothetical protein
VTDNSPAGIRRIEAAQKAVDAVSKQIEQRLAGRDVVPPSYPSPSVRSLGPNEAKEMVEAKSSRLEELESALDEHRSDLIDDLNGFRKHWNEISIVKLAQESEQLRAEAFALRDTAEIERRLKAVKVAGLNRVVSRVAPSHAWNTFRQEVEDVLRTWRKTDTIDAIDDTFRHSWKSHWAAVDDTRKNMSSTQEANGLAALATNPNASLVKGLTTANEQIEQAKADVQRFLDHRPQGLRAVDYQRELTAVIGESAAFAKARTSWLDADAKRNDRLSLIDLVLRHRVVEQDRDYYQAQSEECEKAWRDYLRSAEGQLVAAAFDVTSSDEQTLDRLATAVVSAVQNAEHDFGTGAGL